MRIAVTGASGFVGRKLVDALRARRSLGGRPIERLVLVDRAFDDLPADPLLETIAGDLGQNGCREAFAQTAPDLLFHLAAAPSDAAEADYGLGRRANLDAPIALFDRLAAKPGLVVVHASSLAVFGSPLPRAITDATAPVPTLSYGAHKLMLEVQLADLSRRGKLDARSPRLPAIVARPRSPGHASAFASDIFHALGRGEPFVCPTRPEATVLLESAAACVANLIHAAEIPAWRLPLTRAFLLPCLRVRMNDLAAAIFRTRRLPAAPPVVYSPDAKIEARYASFPATTTEIADALGFAHDGDLDGLCRAVLEGL